MNIILEETLKQLGLTMTQLSEKNLKRIYETFPIPREYKILWADVKLGLRINGLVITDKALIIKADKETLKKYNKTYGNKKDRQDIIYYLIKWEYFDPDDFIISEDGNSTIIIYNKTVILSAEGTKIAKFFKQYKLQIDKLSKASIISDNVFSDFGIATPIDYDSNAIAGKSEMAEEALNLINMLSGEQVEDIDKVNIKNSSDRLLESIQIQAKYCASGTECINDCFDEKTGLFRYLNSDGTPMQIEVPADKYYEAVNAFRNKILEGKVTNVTNPDDASKYIRRGKLTYKQALNLCKSGKIKTLTFDATTGFIYCSYALGITFLATYIISFKQTGDKKQALNTALSAGLQVFGLPFVSYILASQVVRTTFAKQFIPISTYLINSLGYKATQNIASIIRAMSGKGAVSSTAAKQLTQIYKSNFTSAGITFVVFSIPDTYNMFSKKISNAQYTKNMLSLIGTMVSAGCGTLGTSILAAKAGGEIGIKIKPGLGTVIGISGGLAGGLIGGTAIKMLGDKIREDDSIILSRMFNGVVVNLVYEYMLSESELDVLIEKLNNIKPNEFKKLFKTLLSEQQQEKTIDSFVRGYFEEIIQIRPAIAEPTPNDIAEIIKQFGEKDEVVQMNGNLK